MSSTKKQDANQVVTFGCRLNIYESELIKQHAETAGLKNTIIVNTCAVTSEAERQSRQSIRKLKRENPDAEVIVTGCAAQINTETYAAMPEITRVIGNDEKLKLETYLNPSDEKVMVNDIMSVTDTAHHLIAGFENHARAFIQVQNGCNHRCTFCTIPFGRGNSRSVPIGEIVGQINALVKNGIKEVVITGVDVTSYGLDLPGQPGFGQMIKRVLALCPDLPRLRLSSLDPVEVDEDLWHLIEHEMRLMPHLHISLQAGDDMVLKRMKRRHLRQDVVDFCARARQVRPDIVFGADIIAGFPTETDEMFQNTADLVTECDLTWLHVFPYSERDNTPAAKMPPVAHDIRKKRAAILRALGQENLDRFLNAQIGVPQSVIVEQNYIGRSEQFSEIDLSSIKDTISVGDLISVTPTGVKNNKLFI